MKTYVFPYDLGLDMKPATGELRFDEAGNITVAHGDQPVDSFPAATVKEAAVLAGVDDESVAIDLEGEEHTALVPFTWITDAKLVLTDELMKRGADIRAARVQSEQQPPTD